MKFDGFRFELSITPDYVANWKFANAIKELIQNGVDAETSNPKCEFILDYDSENEELIFVNRESSLPLNSLLLGKTTKKDDAKTVGQFGEGYKIAALVLTRLGHTFEIENGNTGNIWKASITTSSNFEDEQVLVFDICQSDEKTNDLVIRIGNVTSEEYGEIEDLWLDFYDDYDTLKKISTDFGDILLGEEYASKVYVNRIFIQEDKSLKYGYNFKPEHIELERDRFACNWVDLRTATSEMTAQALFNDDIDIDIFIEMISDRNSDVYFEYPFARDDTISKKIMLSFEKQYPNCIPVENQERMEMVRKFGGKPVLIPKRIFDYISDDVEREIKKLVEEFDDLDNTLYNKFYVWYCTYCEYIPPEGKKEFRELLSNLIE